MHVLLSVTQGEIITFSKVETLIFTATIPGSFRELANSTDWTEIRFISVLIRNAYQLL